MPDLGLWLEALASPFASIQDFLEAGGSVLYWIVAAGIFMWTLIIERYWYLASAYPRAWGEIENVWRARADHRSWYARRIRAEMISGLRGALEAPLPVLRAMIPLCPLLGLLGTIMGMVQVFDAMLAQGETDQRLMAYGISHAMICTMAGLAMSLSGLFFVHHLETRARYENHRLADLLAHH